MEIDTSSWNDVRELLRAAREELSPGQGTRDSRPIPVGLLGGNLDEFENFLNHNELELAWDALAAIAARVQVSAACWRKLARAAGLMQLPAKEEAARRQAMPGISN